MTKEESLLREKQIRMIGLPEAGIGLNDEKLLTERRTSLYRNPSSNPQPTAARLIEQDILRD